jgi:hypothetical protein
MHQTTLRFPEDLWHVLEDEAKGLGVSVAQYVREAALARAAYDAGRRGQPLFVDTAMIHNAAGPRPPMAGPERSTSGAIAAAQETVTDSAALWAQARLVRRRSEQLREKSRMRDQPRA